MDILVSAIVGDLISRSTSFLVDKYCQQQPSFEENLRRLHKILLRIDTVVEEAEERHITNQGMLRQLKMLIQGMYKGHYVLDAFKYRHALHEEKKDEEEASHSSSTLSISSPAKRLRFSGSGSNKKGLLLGTSNMQELQEIVDTLEDTVANMKEFAILLMSYPRMFRQPYCTYLLVDNCMFGRQMERQQIMNFLLQSESTGVANFDVLPMVGPTRVGKSTLVEHVCRDELVRDHFSMILLFPEKYLKEDGVINLRENVNGVVKHQNFSSKERLLVIVEIAEDIDDVTMNRLKSITTCIMPSGSKIIITSRSNKIVNLGTVEALYLDYLPPEAYWHFFKMIAFGSMDPDEQPKLAAIAMEIASDMMRCFVTAHLVAGLLRNNFSAQFWNFVLECTRACRHKNILLFDEHPNHRCLKDEPVYMWRLTKRASYFLICSYHQLDSTKEVPKISIQDIILGTGGTQPCGEFEVLVIKSRIAPYHNYMIRCMMQAPQHTECRKRHICQ